MSRCEGVKDNPRYHKGAEFGQQCKKDAIEGEPYCAMHKLKAKIKAMSPEEKKAFFGPPRKHRDTFWDFIPADDNGRRYLGDGVYV
jgi:hypothetical protein